MAQVSSTSYTFINPDPEFIKTVDAFLKTQSPPPYAKGQAEAHIVPVTLPLDQLFAAHPASPLKRSGKTEEGASKADISPDLLSKFTMESDAPPELRHCFDRLNGFACSAEVKRVAWTILDRAHKKGCPIKDVVVRCMEDEDVNLYWKGVHHECDVVEADGIVYIRMNRRTWDKKDGWKSNLQELTGSIDKQCSEAVSRLSVALATK